LILGPAASQHRGARFLSEWQFIIASTVLHHQEPTAAAGFKAVQAIAGHNRPHRPAGRAIIDVDFAFQIYIVGLAAPHPW
jgi:hypothetical protein